MSFCPNCGTEIEEGARFCSHCGHGRRGAASILRQSHTLPGGKRLHCPECKSGEISPVVETEITGGTSLNHSFSRKNSISAMQFNNIHRNYWMCSTCGCKFRNIQNLEQEIRNMESLVKRAIFGVIFMVVLTVFDMFAFKSGFFGILGGFLVILFVAVVFILKKRTAGLYEERTYLKRRCFD